MTQWIKILGFSFLGLVIVAGLIFAGYRLGQRQVQPAIVKRSTPTPFVTPLPTPTPDSTADWKTYIDREQGFSVKYPAQWYIDETNRPRQYMFQSPDYRYVMEHPYRITSGASVSIMFERIRPDETLEEWVKSLAFYENVFYTEETAILNQRALRFEASEKDGNDRLNIAFNKGERLIFIQLMYGSGKTNKEEFKNIFTLMLSTFRFLE